MKESLINEFVDLIANRVVEIIETKEGFKSSQNEKEVQSSKLLTTKEASEHFKVHVNTVRSWLQKGELKGKRIGNRLYVIISITEDHEAEF